MNKISLAFIVIGIVILGISAYVYMNAATDNEKADVTAIEESIEYRDSSAFTPKTIRVKEGQKVILRVTSDKADEVHLHGYDISKDIKAGGQIILEFIADKTGRFELELEESETELAAVEIYP